MSTIDELLEGIVASLNLTKASVENSSKTFLEDAEILRPSLVSDLLSTASSGSLEGVSLLNLKSNSLLSYVNNLALILLSSIERTGGAEVEELRNKAVAASIQQRVCLEKGVKPLEKKLAYQLDKTVRAYHRMEADTANAESKLHEKAQEAAKNEGSDSDSEAEDNDALSYKPDASALANLASSAGKSSSSGKYMPPKIAAAALPSASSQKAPRNSKKLQSMEEYLAEHSDRPQLEASIGASIVSHGRSEKTGRDRAREKQIQTYEETNFTRLPSTMTKKNHRQKMADRTHTFAGEDWSIFSSNRDMLSSTSRKRKELLAWDRAKRRRT